MPYVTIEEDVFIDADMFDDDELIKAVKNRLHGKPKSKFSDGIESALYGNCRNGDSLMDTLKKEIINKNLHNKSLDEIEKFFK